MSNAKQAALAKIVEACGNRSSDTVEQLRIILSIARDAGLNLEVMEISLIGQLALAVASYAESTGRLDELQAAATSNHCDYSKFDETYIRRCRGMHAGGLI